MKLLGSGSLQGSAHPFWSLLKTLCFLWKTWGLSGVTRLVSFSLFLFKAVIWSNYC